MTSVRIQQAALAALEDEMRSDDSVVALGEDVAVARGPFTTSEGLLEEFGRVRMRDTPILARVFTGSALAVAALGLRPGVEIMFMALLGVESRLV